MVCEQMTKNKAYGPNDTTERLYIMTFHRIYTFKKALRTRSYNIKDVGAIIESSDNDRDFMLFFEKSDDLHCNVKGRSDLLNMLKLRFNNINRDLTLRHFSVSDKELTALHVNNNSKNKMAGIFDLPEDSNRLFDQEVKGEEEYNEDLKRRKGQVDDAPFEYNDFGFEKSAADFGGNLGNNL